MQKLTSQPIFFERNRVFRVYLGGMPYAGLFNSNEPGDNNFPEEWVASSVKAINPQYFGERDGVSKVEGTDYWLDDLLRDCPDTMLGHRRYDCLVKFLDSAIRLPVQAHPTKEFSRQHFNSNYGKTEAWLVVATRPNAKIFFGFKDKMTKERLMELESLSETDRNAMESTLSYVDAKVGDIYIIHAGLVHAIGAGCTIIEVQEPTDFTIQPERWCGDYHLSENEEYIGLSKELAMDVFNFDLYGEAAVNSAKVTPRVVSDKDGLKVEELISYDVTESFAQNRYTLTGGSVVPSFGPAVWIVLDGEVTITGEDYSKTVKGATYFFLPYAAEGKFTITGNATLIECLPSKQD